MVRLVSAGTSSVGQIAPAWQFLPTHFAIGQGSVHETPVAWIVHSGSSQANGHSHFHLYVCAAFLIYWKSELMKKNDFHTLLMFLQNLPTRNFAEKEIDLLVAEAYRLSYLFADAPSHLQGCRSNASI